MNILISTVTHSRPKGLETLLKSLQALSIPDGAIVEICVVDNDCTGNNDPVIERLQNAPLKVNFLKEPRKGIVYARNTAVEYFLNSPFNMLAFIDDDEWTNDAYWLENLLDAQRKTGADIVTSDVLTFPQSDKISWTTGAMGRVNNLVDLQKKTKFYTGNVLIKRLVLETIKPAFDERFALTGSSDFHFSLKCRNAGFKAVYTDKAQVSEIFPESRATLKWFCLRGYRNGIGAARGEFFEAKNKISVIAKLFLMALIRSGRGLLTMLRAAIQLDKGILALGLMRFSAGLGTIAGIFGFTHEEYKNIHGK